MKKVFVGGDGHCGSDIGWTHLNDIPRGPAYKPTRQASRWVDKQLEEYGPFDLALCTGDMVDGPQKKSGGTGLITSDIYKQLDMAERVLNKVRMHGRDSNFKMAAATGTCYHVDIEGTSAEHYLKDRGCFDLVGDRLLLDVEGFTIDLCHKTGKSGVPYGNLTAAHKEAMWNVVHEQAGTQDHVDCVLRGHTHEMSQSWTPEAGWAFKVPALQLSGGKYGRQVCRGYCHFGFLVLHIDNGKLVEWHAPHMKVTPTDLRVQSF
jgi:hypothetical protein